MFGDASADWRKGHECTAPTINEETLQKAVGKAINELWLTRPDSGATTEKPATVFNGEATIDVIANWKKLQQQLLIQANPRMTMKMWLMKFTAFE